MSVVSSRNSLPRTILIVCHIHVAYSSQQEILATWGMLSQKWAAVGTTLHLPAARPRDSPVRTRFYSVGDWTSLKPRLSIPDFVSQLWSLKLVWSSCFKYWSSKAALLISVWNNRYSGTWKVIAINMQVLTHIHWTLWCFIYYNSLLWSMLSMNKWPVPNVSSVRRFYSI